MYQVSVKGHFDAAHYLRGYQGRCENLHGHRFEVVVTLSGKGLDEKGMLRDFTEIKADLKQILAHLDHVCLNDGPPFDVLNPSSENIARFIYGEMKGRLADTPVSLASVQVYESPDAWATYAE